MFLPPSSFLVAEVKVSKQKHQQKEVERVYLEEQKLDPLMGEERIMSETLKSSL